MKKLALLLFLVLPALAQNPVVPFRSPRVTFQTATGQPLSGGCIFTYQGGTTTPQATYTSSTGAFSNTNPVILDTTGSAVMWLGANTYKFVAYSAGGYHCSSGSLQWTVDQVPGDAFLNGTISGATITNPTITGGTITGTAISGSIIEGSNINSTSIGQTTPGAGNFTSLASPVDALSFSATPIFPAGSYGYFTMTLTNNVTSSTITGGQTGQLITFNICQNGTGQVVGGQTTGFTFAWPSTYLNPPLINPVLNSCTITTAYYDGGYWNTVTSNTQLLLGNLETLAFTATPVFPASSYSNFFLTLTNNVTSSTITGGTKGQVATLDICQNGTGSYTFVWPTNLLHAPVVQAASSTCTSVVAVYNGTNWNTVGSASSGLNIALTGNFDQIPFTATPVFNADNYSGFNMVLSGNVTSSSIAGGTPGQLITISITQGSSSTTAPTTAPTSSTSTSGGFLPDTTTYYAKCAYIFGVIESLPSAESYRSTGAGSNNSIQWNCPSYVGVTTYKFYLGTGTGAENFYFTSSSASFTQTGIPSTGTPGVPFTSSTYTVVWPANIISPPAMTTGIGATTGFIAVFNGTNWTVVGSNFSGFSSGSNADGFWEKSPTGHIHQWGTVTVNIGSSLYGTAPLPVAFSSHFDSIVINSQYTIGSSTLLTPNNLPIPASSPHAGSLSLYDWHFESNVSNAFSGNLVFSFEADGY